MISAASPRASRRKKLDQLQGQANEKEDSKRKRKKKKRRRKSRSGGTSKHEEINTHGHGMLAVLWALLSGLASVLACTGFYLPYWIQGRLLGQDAYFGSFRRCNYPRATSRLAVPQIVLECARYSSFKDIPSPWWRASTVAIGFGLAVAVIGSLTLLAAVTSFLPHVLRKPRHTRVLGSFQLLAATMICGGLVMYPIGWDNQEVRDACGKDANVYYLGKCSLSWSSYLLVGAVVLLLLCFGLSFCAARHKPSPGNEDPLRI